MEVIEREEEPPARITLNNEAQWKEANRTLEWKHPHAIDCSFRAGRSFEPLPFALMTAYQCAIKSIVHQGDEENTQFRTLALPASDVGFFIPSSPCRCTLTPIEGQSKSRLQGDVSQVLFATGTDELLVPVTLSSGQSRIAIIDVQQRGVSIENQRDFSQLSPFKVADVRFQDVLVMDDSLLPDEDPIRQVIQPIQIVLVCLVLSVALGYIKRIDTSAETDKQVELLENISTERDLEEKQVQQELAVLCQQIAKVLPSTPESQLLRSMLTRMDPTCR